MIASLSLLVIGFWRLWRIGGIEKIIGLVVVTHIALNWLISMGTLGDHRQRLPILGLSIFLQAVGLKTIFKGKSGALVDGPALPPKVALTSIPN
jgi:multisubunit Na+/H+ antiporter MnhC subunit